MRIELDIGFSPWDEDHQLKWEPPASLFRHKKSAGADGCGDHDVVAHDATVFTVREYFDHLRRTWRGRVIAGNPKLCKCGVWQVDDLEYDLPGAEAFSWQPKEWPSL